MKKMFSLFICVLLVFAMTACGDNETGNGKISNKSTGVNDVLEQEMAKADSKSETEGQQVEQVDEARQNGVSEDAPKPEPESSEELLSTTDGIDVDLTILSSTVVYSEVYNMMVSPSDYIGKTVKMNGMFTMYRDQSSGKCYFACIISDATACCAQGIEFVLTDEYTFPDDYPQEGEDICVIGTFDTYKEGGFTYCTLRDARIA
ncbi:MAG: hypothetical protein K6D96_06195 [Acetatifactor sp.]|nr:hypothetical protein [Acetatifactor sp.]